MSVRSRTFGCARSTIVVAALLYLCIAAHADIPAPHLAPVPPPVAAPAAGEAQLRVTYDATIKEATLRIPRKFADRFVERDAANASGASSERKRGLFVVTTVVGGIGLAMGASLLGTWFVRRGPKTATRVAVFAVVGVAAFAGLGTATADLLPFSRNPGPPPELDASRQTLRIVFLDEGDVVELVLPEDATGFGAGVLPLGGGNAPAPQ